jgi:hypothetical protein
MALSKKLWKKELLMQVKSWLRLELININLP